MGRYYIAGESPYNGVLWTMKRELFGSLGIYIVFGLATSTRGRLVAGALASVAVIAMRIEPQSYLCFVAGSIMYLWRGSLTKCPAWLGTLAIVLGAILGGKPFLTPAPAGTFYSSATPFWPIYGSWQIGAVLVLFGVLTSPHVARFFNNRIGRFLGRISFGLYLVHFTLLHSLMVYLFVQLSGLRFGFVLAIAGYVAALLIAAPLFTIIIDENAVRLSQALKTVLPRPKTTPRGDWRRPFDPGTDLLGERRARRAF
jgi:peptidoglycan/LPS O-acetylase OafA/YrhL